MTALFLRTRRRRVGLQRLFRLLKLRQSRPDAAAATRTRPRAVACSEHGFLKLAFPFPLAPASPLAIGGGVFHYFGEGGGKGCLFVCTACWLVSCDKR